MKTTRRLLLIGSLAIVAAASSSNQAGRRTGNASPDAPRLPATWVNGPALSNDVLRGKVVFLVFFEET